MPPGSASVRLKKNKEQELTLPREVYFFILNSHTTSVGRQHEAGQSRITRFTAFGLSIVALEAHAYFDRRQKNKDEQSAEEGKDFTKQVEDG